MRVALAICALVASLTACTAPAPDPTSTPVPSASVDVDLEAEHRQVKAARAAQIEADYAETHARAMASLESARDIISARTRLRVLEALAKLDEPVESYFDSTDAIAEVDEALEAVRDEVADWVSEAER